MIAIGLKLLSRQWNANLLKILALAFFLAISLQTAISTLSDRLNRSVTEQANTMLGADWILESTRPMPPEWQEKAQSMGLETTESAVFLSVILFNEEPILARINAIHQNFPLRGHIKNLKPTEYISPQTVWLQSDWRDRYSVNFEDRITIGERDFAVMGFFDQAPEVGTTMFNIAPRILMNHDDLEATGIIQPGSRIYYYLFVAGQSELIQRFSDWLHPQLTPNQRIIDADEGQPALGITIDRVRQYLSLATIASVLLAGLTIFVAMRDYAQSQVNTVALLRCLGTSTKNLYIIYLGTLFIVSLFLSLLSGLLGYALQAMVASTMTKMLFITLPPANWIYLFYSFIAGLLLVIGFALPQLISLQKITALRILREDISNYDLKSMLVMIFVIASSFGLLVLYTESVELTLWLLLILSVGIVLLWAFLLLGLIFLAKIRGLFKMPWRLGFQRLLLYPNEASLQVISTSVALGLVFTLFFVRFDMVNQWEQKLPENAPNYFIINILTDQLPNITSFFTENNVVDKGFYPIVKARLIAINGNPIKLDDFPPHDIPNYIQRELNNTYLDAPKNPADILQGQWWPEHTPKYYVSVEQSVAQTLDIHLHDTLTFQTGSQTFDASVANTRKVIKDNFEPWFYMIFSPSALQHLPHTYLTSFYLPPENKPFITLLQRTFPNVTTFSVADLLDEVRKLVAQASDYMSGLFIAIMLAALLVLVTIQHAQLSFRMYEGKLLRTLGASRKQIAIGWLSEFCLLGILAGIVAFLLATQLGGFIATQQLNIVFHFKLIYLPISIVLAVLLHVGIGSFAIARLSYTPPL